MVEGSSWDYRSHWGAGPEWDSCDLRVGSTLGVLHSSALYVSLNISVKDEVLSTSFKIKDEVPYAFLNHEIGHRTIIDQLKRFISGVPWVSFIALSIFPTLFGLLCYFLILRKSLPLAAALRWIYLFPLQCFILNFSNCLRTWVFYVASRPVSKMPLISQGDTPFTSQ